MPACLPLSCSVSPGLAHAVAMAVSKEYTFVNIFLGTIAVFFKRRASEQGTQNMAGCRLGEKVDKDRTAAIPVYNTRIRLPIRYSCLGGSANQGRDRGPVDRVFFIGKHIGYSIYPFSCPFPLFVINYAIFTMAL